MTRAVPVGLLALALLAVFALPALAQEGSSTTENARPPVMPAIRPDTIKERIDGARTNVAEWQTKHAGIMQEHQAAIEERKQMIEERRGDIETRAKEIRAKFASSTDEFRARIEERRTAIKDGVREHLAQAFGTMKGRMEAMVERLAQITDRIEDRAEKIKTAGGDTDATEQYIADARTSLESARSLIASLSEESFDEVVDAESPRERFEAVRGDIEAVRTHLRSAHESIKSAVEALKEAARATGPGVSDAVSADEEKVAE